MTKYFNFLARSTRSEYWGVIILSSIFFILAAVLGSVIMAVGSAPGLLVGGLILIVAFVSTVWANIATTVRRCRDAGINPWWTASVVIPYVGFVTWIVIGCLKTVNRNENLV
jgi:uncharacterized membrane protein YhaH (DUF805 family)